MWSGCFMIRENDFLFIFIKKKTFERKQHQTRNRYPMWLRSPRDGLPTNKKTDRKKCVHYNKLSKMSSTRNGMEFILLFFVGFLHKMTGQHHTWTVTFACFIIFVSLLYVVWVGDGKRVNSAIFWKAFRFSILKKSLLWLVCPFSALLYKGTKKSQETCLKVPWLDLLNNCSLYK